MRSTKLNELTKWIGERHGFVPKVLFLDETFGLNYKNFSIEIYQHKRKIHFEIFDRPKTGNPVMDGLCRFCIYKSIPFKYVFNAQNAFIRINKILETFENNDINAVNDALIKNLCDFSE